MDALTDEDVTKVVCVFRISVENQIPLAAKDAVLGIGDIARNLRHPSIVGVGVMPAMWTDREAMSMKNRM